MNAPSELHTIVSGATLEWWLTEELAFGLTSATPLQRAICRVLDGQPLEELAYHPDVVAAFGCEPPSLMRPPREFSILAGIRAGKSLLAACLAARATQVCDLSKVGPGEIPRVSIVSTKRDLAEVVFSHVVGRLQASPLLSGLIAGEPSADTIHLRHPSGRLVQISVVAGSRAGTSLVARWSAGCVFDEFPRMVGEGEGVVNWDDSRAAVYARLLPGAQIVNIGSPWTPFGPAYEQATEYHGKPSTNLVVVRAPGPAMNPVWWTPERVEEAKADPDVYRTDVLAEFRSPGEALFSLDLLNRCTRTGPEMLGAEGQASYSAAMDPATRGNGWTFVIVTRQGKMKRVAYAREWRGSQASPLNPETVMAEIASICNAYDVRSIDTDQWMGDALSAIGRRWGLGLAINRWTSEQRAERYLALRTRLEMGEIELAPVPQLKTDLLRVQKKVTQRGVSIELPLSEDGRHCDYAPALVLAMSRYLDDYRPEPLTPEVMEAERMRKAQEARFKKQKETW